MNDFKLVLVEDDEDHADIFTRFLELEEPSWNITWLKDGIQALDYLNKSGVYQNATTPNLVILDLKLPNRSGFEVLRQIKEDANLRTIPVVILTTSDHQSDKLLAYNFHANSFLVKPLEFEKYRESIKCLTAYWGDLNRRLNIL